MGEYLAKYKIHGYHQDPNHARGRIDTEYTKEKEVRFLAQTDEEAVQLSKDKRDQIYEERIEAAFRGGFSVHRVNLESLFEIREIDLRVPLKKTRQECI